MYDYKKITDYILYLRRECGLSVSVHTSETDNFLLGTPIASFNIHENPYCILIKSSKDACLNCVKKQCRVLEKAKKIGPYVGTCHAGVTEFVYPICHNDTVFGFLSVSGYAIDGSQKVRSCSEKYDIDKNALLSAYGSLKRELPSREYVDTLVFPLLDMIELAYAKHVSASTTSNTFFDAVATYIRRNYTLDLTSESLCRHFSCSRSHLSHTFNAHAGKTIREFINDLRVESAKVMLKSSDLTIAEIATSLGYTDPNYFTGVFKRITGKSPTSYKREGN